MEIRPSSPTGVKTLAVAILNWNGSALLERFLPGVVEHSPEADIYVIDNASTDNSLEVLKDFQGVNVLVNRVNSGYTGGYNFGLEHIHNPWVVLLNSDVEVTPGWLKPIEKALEIQGVAAIQPKILDLNRRDHFEYAGGSGGFIDRWGYPFCRGRILFEREQDHGQYNRPEPIFWASGACLVVKRSVFFEAGRLDPVFFAHFEEIDLCWRIHHLGYSVWSVPDSVVYHLGGGTLDMGSPRKTFYNFRNNLFLLFKNLPSQRLFGLILLRLFLDGLAGIHFLLQGKAAHTRAILKSHISFYAHLGLLMHARQELKAVRRKKWPSGVYRRSVIVDFYLRKRRRFSDLNQSAFVR